MASTKRPSARTPARPHVEATRLVCEHIDPAVPWALRPSVLQVIANLYRTQAAVPAEHAEEFLTQAAAPRADVRTAEDQAPGGDVAIISLRGILTARPSLLGMLLGGGRGLEAFRRDFREALADPDIGAIVIDIDSPGGSTDLCEETAAEIRAARGAKPIVAVANTMAGSGAYWIASAANELVGTPSALVGSIGVYMLHEDWSAFNEILGVAMTYVSAGEFKTEGNDNEPLSDEGKAAWQATVDDFYDLFAASVAAGRNVPEQTVRDGFGQGRVLPAKRALAAGMIDRIESLEQTVDRLFTQIATSRAGSGALATLPSFVTEAQARELLGIAADAAEEEFVAAWAEHGHEITPDRVAAHVADPDPEADPPPDPPDTDPPPPVAREDAPVPALLLPTPRRH